MRRILLLIGIVALICVPGVEAEARRRAVPRSGVALEWNQTLVGYPSIVTGGTVGHDPNAPPGLNTSVAPVTIEHGWSDNSPFLNWIQVLVPNGRTNPLKVMLYRSKRSARRI